MKILEINAVCGEGSTGRICVELAEEITNYGHEVYILYGNGRGSYPNSKKIAYKHEVILDALFSRITGLNAYGAYAGTQRIISFIKVYRPDIVHLHNVHANYINLNILLKFLAKKEIATVITLHDCWFYTGKCTHYSADKCYKWIEGCNKCPKLKEDIPSWFFDRTKKMLLEKKKYFKAIPRLGVIGVSEWITKEAQKSFLKESLKIETIYNWIDLNVFYPRNIDCIRKKHNIIQGRFVILCVSENWSKNSQRFKNLKRLIKEAEKEWLFLVVGHIEKDELESPNVIKVGYIKDINVLAEYYNVADVYVHLSTEDTFGKVIVEAMACGTPAVVYNTTAYPELVKVGCGYVVNENNIKEVCDKVKQIERKGKEFYLNNCVVYTKANFSKTKLIDKTMKFYGELLE